MDDSIQVSDNGTFDDQRRSIRRDAEVHCGLTKEAGYQQFHRRCVSGVDGEDRVGHSIYLTERLTG